MPGDFVWQFLDGNLSEFDLNPQGMRFAEAYYRSKSASFLADYERLAEKESMSRHRMPDSWATYEAVASMISSRYRSWLAAD